MFAFVFDVQPVVSDYKPVKLLVCQLDEVAVQDAADVVLLDVSSSVVVKQTEHSDHGPQVASDLQVGVHAE